MIKHFNPKWYFQDRLTEIDQQKIEDMFADIYNDGDGSNPHLHFRKRLDEPHQLSSDIWKKMDLNTCKCEENTENPEFVYGHRFTSNGIFPQNYYTSSHAVESSFNKIN